MQKLDLANWNRKEHFEFFRKFEEPFFGLTASIDCTKAYDDAKTLGVSFFIYYLHKTLMTVNALEPFRYRIHGDEIIIHDKVNVSSTILRENKTFGFSFMEYAEDILVFNTICLKEIERVRNAPGLFTRDFNEVNLIHFSSIPWVDFTSLSHARSFSFPDSCPKISFGKMTIDEKGIKSMPLSIHVHHGLMDGYHVGQFVELFQNLMNS